MNRAVIGLGSNIDPDHNIQRAIRQMEQQFELLAVSEVIETAPVGHTRQANFRNGAVLLATPLDLDGLTSSLKAIESALGRDPGGERYGPRTIDLDVVVWNATVVDPDFYARDFLHNAVLEVLPGFKGQ